MNKRLLTVVLALVMVILCGCQLAVPEAEEAAQPDRLVGIYVTRDYLDLFDMEAYLNDNLSTMLDGGTLTEADTGDYSQRIYAEIVERTFVDSMGEEHITYSYEFPELGGMLMASYEMKEEYQEYWRSDVETGLCDANFRIDIRDDGVTLEQSATIYVPEGSGDTEFYFNPVYQTADGQLYLIAGSGVSMSGTMGGAMTSKLNEETTYTVDGETTTFCADLAVTVDTIAIPDRIVVIQMDENHQELCREEYIPGQMPESLTPMDATAYILVESCCGQQVQRTLYQPEGDPICAYYNMGNNICIPDYTQIEWPTAE